MAGAGEQHAGAVDNDHVLAPVLRTDPATALHLQTAKTQGRLQGRVVAACYQMDHSCPTSFSGKEACRPSLFLTQQVDPAEGQKTFFSILQIFEVFAEMSVTGNGGGGAEPRKLW